MDEKNPIGLYLVGEDVVSDTDKWESLSLDSGINIFDMHDGSKGCEFYVDDCLVKGDVLDIEAIPDAISDGWLAIADAARELKSPFNRMQRSLSACMANLQEVLLNNYLSLVGQNKQSSVKDRRRYRAYLRSKRNQEHPLKMKKRKHGRTYRVRRRK